jgi:hypothetical protein
MYRFDPLGDNRWDQFLLRHPHSSVFHASAWIKALADTYGYTAVAFTTSPPAAELRNAVLFCRIDSWLTGRRLVSLPFSDHCELLTSADDSLTEIWTALEHELAESDLRYIELRPVHPLAPMAARRLGATYCLHLLDLTPSLDDIFSRFHKDSTQRKIRRAESEGLSYEEGTSNAFLDEFLRLRLLTQRRHGVPPQPTKWFRNLIECFGERLKIRVAFRNKKAIAAILTLQYKNMMVYKYGGSDAQSHRFGGMHLLLWRSIQEAKQQNLALFDFGRSDWSNPGLIAFKDRWGAARSNLTYSLISDPATFKPHPLHTEGDWKSQIGRRFIPYLPDALLRTIGSAVYRHIG